MEEYGFSGQKALASNLSTGKNKVNRKPLVLGACVQFE
jgi:hypothetical protein